MKAARTDRLAVALAALGLFLALGAVAPSTGLAQEETTANPEQDGLLPEADSDWTKLARLGMPEEQWPDYRAWRDGGGTLTSFYNRQIGGSGRLAAGWSLIGAAVPLTLLGGYTLFETARFGDDLHKDDDPAGAVLGSMVYALSGAFGVVFTVAGVGLGAGGTVLVIQGERKTERWLEPGTLEGSSTEEVERYRQQGPWPAETSAVRLRMVVTPLAVPGACGAGLAFVF